MDEALATRTSLRSTAVTVNALSDHDSIFDGSADEDPASNHPEWCVDLGGELKAMNKFELWLALGTGDVAADARVWKLGRECWQPAQEIPDLACALKLHANLLIATVQAATEMAEDERPTLTPGELPALLTTEEASPMIAKNHSDETLEGSTDTKKASLPEAVLETNASPETLRPVTSSAEPSSHDGLGLRASETYELEAKSVTPGPAVVDESSLTPPPVLRRRAASRKRAASPLTTAVAFAAIVATSLFAATRVTGVDAPSAAAHLPVLAAPREAPLPVGGPVEQPSLDGAAPQSVLGPVVDAKTPAAPSPALGASTVETERRVEHHAGKPSKHRVRPTSVSPSHRGQGRLRQHTR